MAHVEWKQVTPVERKQTALVKRKQMALVERKQTALVERKRMNLAEVRFGRTRIAYPRNADGASTDARNAKWAEQRPRT